jgi:hypothetical protein
MKPVSQWGKPMALRTEEQVSSFALDVRALHYVVNDTVVETRGVPVVAYRPGDVLQSIRGARFIR